MADKSDAAPVDPQPIPLPAPVPGQATVPAPGVPFAIFYQAHMQGTDRELFYGAMKVAYGVDNGTSKPIEQWQKLLDELVRRPEKV